VAFIQNFSKSGGAGATARKVKTVGNSTKARQKYRKRAANLPLALTRRHGMCRSAGWPTG
jgi:hypothetical protein